MGQIFTKQDKELRKQIKDQKRVDKIGIKIDYNYNTLVLRLIGLFLIIISIVLFVAINNKETSLLILQGLIFSSIGAISYLIYLTANLAEQMWLQYSILMILLIGNFLFFVLSYFFEIPFELKEKENAFIAFFLIFIASVVFFITSVCSKLKGLKKREKNFRRNSSRFIPRDLNQYKKEFF